MKLTRFTKEHYPMLVEWWTAHKHPVIPMEMISPFGLLASNYDDKFVAASFIYFVAGCDIAQISWTTSNPTVSPRLRYDGIESTVKGLIALAKENGRTNIVSFAHSRSLSRMYSKQGLKELQDHKLMYSKLGAM